jgi:hypothetical protein
MAKAHLAAMHIEGTDAEIQAAMKSFLESLPPSDQTVIATATPDAQKKTTQGDVASPSSTAAASPSGIQPTRQRVYECLAAAMQPMRVVEIMAALELRQPPISKALNGLVANGLVRNFKQGKASLYEATAIR